MQDFAVGDWYFAPNADMPSFHPDEEEIEGYNDAIDAVTSLTTGLFQKSSLRPAEGGRFIQAQL